MDSAEQAEGEKRVRQLLVEPLMRRGLAKPSTLTNVKFEEMLADLCARLAYMTEANLMALEEQMAGKPGGKDRDRFPIANQILDDARGIQPPGDDASPLIRAVFAHQLGQDALAGGWAPELLAELRQNRRWPGAWAVKTVKERAGDATRRMRDLDARLARGGGLSEPEVAWRQRRLTVIRKCQEISDLGKENGGLAC